MAEHPDRPLLPFSGGRSDRRVTGCDTRSGWELVKSGIVSAHLTEWGLGGFGGPFSQNTIVPYVPKPD